MSRLIDADKFLAYLIYSGLIDDAKCGNIVKAVEKCEVKAILLDKVEQIRTEIETEKVVYPPSTDYYKAIMKALQIIDKYRQEG